MFAYMSGALPGVCAPAMAVGIVASSDVSIFHHTDACRAQEALLADTKVVAVGLPDVGKVKQTATYTDTTIHQTTRDMPVGDIVDRAEPGVDVAPAVCPSPSLCSRLAYACGGVWCTCREEQSPRT